ncbi:MAG: tetratricopeptide repeat protein [Saprospiraceae bacterium]|nr:tetratricopeptide repeat protein [Saprospiraceae bacterium]
MTDNTKNSVMQNLWNRRFFQYLATYLAASWGLIQFVEWIVNRYNFDSTWVDNVAIFLFAMLPAVASFIYVHGRPGHDSWRPFEKIFYPINLVLALSASIFLFQGVAQEQTREVEVTTMEGDTITRIVPSQSVTSEIVFFPFDIEVEGEEWLRYGIPYLIDKDIEQDMKWYSIQPISLKEDYLDLGQKLDDDIPLGNKIKIAADKYGDFFADGKVTKSDGMYNLELNVYNAKNGRVENSTTLSSEDIYSLADQATSFVRDNFNNIQLDNLDTTIDLPAKDLVSNNVDVYRTYIEAYIAYNKGPDYYNEAFTKIDQSVVLDDACGECWFIKTQFDQLRGQDGKSTIEKAINSSTSLPERQRFQINFVGYLVKDETQKAIRLLDSWKKLYPSDITPYDKLIGYYSQTFQFSEAKKIAEEAVENGHKGRMLLQAARLNIRGKDFDKAEQYINEFKKRYPKKSKTTPVLAEVYIAKGEFEKAIPIYEEQSILNPSTYGNQLKLAECHYKMNNIEQADKYYQEALRQSNTPRDTLTVINDRMTYLSRFGRYDEYDQDRSLHREVFESINPPEAYLQTLIMTGMVDAVIGDTVKTNANKQEIIDLAPPFAKQVFGPILDYVYSLAYEDGESYKKAYVIAKPFIIQSIGERGTISSDAMLHYFNEEYEPALEKLKEFEKIAGTSILDNSDVMARCYIGSDQVDEGLGYINDLLVGDSNHPIGLVSKAMLLKAKGKEKELKEVLSMIDVVLADAHPQWRYKLQAEEMKASLNDS